MNDSYRILVCSLDRRRKTMRTRSTKRLFAVALAVAVLMIAAVTSAQNTGWWVVAGHNLFNTHSQPAEDQISPENAATLVEKWSLTTAGNVTATPTVYQGVVYVPDMGGRLWAVNAGSGQVRWSRLISSYTGIAGDVSRTSPAIAGSSIILGDGWIRNNVTAGAHVFAVDRRTGNRLWLTRVHEHLTAIITSSPVVDNGVAYVGIASKEEGVSGTPGYQCCTFRGAVVALDVRTGQILWKTYMVPSNNNDSDINLPGFYSGNGVWGSSPVVDRQRGLLYVGTANNFSAPDGVCKTPEETGCEESGPDNHFDSIVALRLSDGAITWATRTIRADVFSAQCFCGPDLDFGAAPNLFTIRNPSTGQPQQVLGIGQKSGDYWALNPDDGGVVWRTKVGPGGLGGGVEWGTATDGERIYVAEANTSRRPFTLSGTGPFAGTTVTSGYWSALNPATGAILWQTPDPLGSKNPGFVSTANGVVYVGSAEGSGGNMYALDGTTGAVLWSFASGGSVFSAPAVVQGKLYWGSGYTRNGACPNGFNSCTANNKLYSFGLP
jgi:polyvinyl alcohol dehydrogenase (cytochrome)